MGTCVYTWRDVAKANEMRSPATLFHSRNHEFQTSSPKRSPTFEGIKTLSEEHPGEATARVLKLKENVFYVLLRAQV